ncbi:putative Ig domain-containing protein [Vibrio sp. 10N.261.54.A5]|uniref:putative Ig domain-containing protein n=1 Tax=Vibrio sp. 10N.261.54.A5 TaxID=3229686 RepID=UPI0035527FAC
MFKNLILISALLASTTASASHFRGGSIKWQLADLDGGGVDNDVTLTITTAWALNRANTISVSSGSSGLNADNGMVLVPVDGSEVRQNFSTDSDTANQYTLQTSKFTASNIDLGEQYNVYYKSCCRISNLQNNSDDYWKIQTIIDPRNGNQAPTIQLPIILEVPKLQADGVTSLVDWTYQLNVLDPDGDRVSYRMANLDELGGEGVNPVGISIDTATGLITWTGSGSLSEGLYSGGFVVEDFDADNAIKSKTHVDLIFYLQDKSTTEEFYLSDNIPSETKTITLEDNTPFTFTVDGAGITTENIGNVFNASNEPALTDNEENQFTFDPDGLEPGVYPINLSVKESEKIRNYLTINFIIPNPDAPSITYFPGDGATSLNGDEVMIDVGSDAVIVSDDSSFDGYTLSVSTPSVTNHSNQITLRSVGTGSNEILIDGSSVLFESVTIGALVASDSNLAISFGANATLAAMEATLRSVVFTSDKGGADADNSTRIMTTKIEDTNGNANNYTTSVTISGSVNHPPVANGVLSPVGNVRGSDIVYHLPINYFTDLDNDVLTLDIQSLLAGLSISYDHNAGTATISGKTTLTTALSNYGVTVTARDGNGGVANANFIINVNPNLSPVFNNEFSAHSRTEDIEIEAIDTALAYSDPEGGMVIVGSVLGLPAGLSFDSDSGLITGTAITPGVYSAAISATDDGGRQSSNTFNIEILNSNDAPVANQVLVNQVFDITDVGDDLNYTLADASFVDEDITQGQSDTITYSATLSNGDPLPLFISFSTEQKRFVTAPTWYDIGTYTITVTARDIALESATSDFTIEVTGTNTMPMKHHWTTLEVNEGGGITFVHDDVHFMDVEQNYDDLVYVITRLPEYGALFKSNTELAVNDTFTQADIETESDIRYVHDGSETTEDTFHFYVSDGYGLQTQEYTDYEIVITPVNDAPIVDQGYSDAEAPTGSQTTQELLSDIFSDIDNDSLSYSLVGAPSWLTLSGTTLTMNPTTEHIGEYTITLRASDDEPLSVDTTFDLAVLLDTDLDQMPDVYDSDDDGDGMPDNWEREKGFDPLNGEDGEGDADNDGRSNRDEFAKGNNPHDDDVNPVIELPSNLNIYATSLFTKVDAERLTGGDWPTASDYGSGDCCEVFLEEYNSGNTYLRSGRHLIQWKAVDYAGNVQIQEQQVDIHPMISLSKDVSVRDGSKGHFKVVLSGLAPEYPLFVDLGISGDAEHGLDSHTIVFEEADDYKGKTDHHDMVEEVVDYTIFLTDSNAVSESLYVELLNVAHTSLKATHETLVVSEITLPKFRLRITQDDTVKSTLVANGGDVSFELYDSVNGQLLNAEEFSIAWQYESNQEEFIDLLTLQASDLKLGVNTVSVMLVNRSNKAFQIKRSYSFNVVAQGRTFIEGVDTDGDGIYDIDEGMSDENNNGIPDYLDVVFVPHILPHKAMDMNKFIIESDPGVHLSLGDSSISNEHSGALVDSDHLQGLSILPDEEVNNVGGMFDFNVNELTLGQVVNVVIPQREPVPVEAVYRKYSTTTGWADFVENDTDYISSAPGEEGYCPPPSSGEYTRGMSIGDWCIQLTMKEGGANDSDGIENGVLKDPGGVGVRGYQSMTSTNSSSGGNMSVFALMVLALLLLLRNLRTAIAGGAIVLTAMSLSFSAQANGFYLNGSFGLGYGNTSDGELQSKISEVSSTAMLTSQDQDDFYFALGGGYRFNSYIALEAAYVDLGSREFTATDSVPDLEVDEFAESMSKLQLRSAQGGTVGFALSYPIADYFSVYVKGGAFFWYGEYNSHSTNTDTLETMPMSDSDNGIDGYYGAGLMTMPWHGISIGAEWVRYDIDSYQTDTAAVNLRYYF